MGLSFPTSIPIHLPLSLGHFLFCKTSIPYLLLSFTLFLIFTLSYSYNKKHVTFKLVRLIYFSQYYVFNKHPFCHTILSFIVYVSTPLCINTIFSSCISWWTQVTSKFQLYKLHCCKHSYQGITEISSDPWGGYLAGE